MSVEYFIIKEFDLCQHTRPQPGPCIRHNLFSVELYMKMTMKYSGFRLTGTRRDYNTLSQLAGCPNYTKLHVKS
jgi:hypothetical protein